MVLGWAIHSWDNVFLMFIYFKKRFVSGQMVGQILACSSLSHGMFASVVQALQTDDSNSDFEKSGFSREKSRFCGFEIRHTPSILPPREIILVARYDTFAIVVQALQIDGANYELRRRPFQANLTEVIQRESDLDMGADNFRRVAPVSHSFTVRSVLNAQVKRRQKEIMEKSLEEKNARK